MIKIALTILRIIPFLLIIVITIQLLTACHIGELTPETLILSKLTGDDKLNVHPSSIKILFKQSLKEKQSNADHIFLFVRYFTRYEVDKQRQCTALYETFKEENKWISRLVSGNCIDVDSAGFTGGWGGVTCTNYLEGHRQDADALYSYISGQEALNSADSVRIIWEDGQSQTIKLRENIFFAMREGKINHQRLEWLDKEGNMIKVEESVKDPCSVIFIQ